MASDAKVIFETVLDESGLKRGMSRLQSSSGGLAAGFGAALGTIGAGLVSGVVASVTSMVDQSIEAASNLQEVQNVVDETFEKSAESVNNWAKTAKDAYGMGELSAKKYVSTLGAMLDSVEGFTSDQVLSMSKMLVGLTGDMTSFYNLDYESSFDKAKTIITGESEQFKALGVNMSVANLEA